MSNILEKILYGIKVSNDNIVILNEKIDDLIKSFNVDEEPKGDAGSEKIISASEK